MNKPIAIPCRVLTTVAAFVLFAPFAAGGEKVVDEAFGFTLTLPDGFVANEQIANARPDSIHGFILGDPTDQELDILLMIERMRGKIGNERLDPSKVPPGHKGRIFTTQWQGFTVDALTVPEVVQGIAMITYNVQIPLKKEAIQLSLVTTAERENELNPLLAEILSNLEGESNWIRASAPKPAGPKTVSPKTAAPKPASAKPAPAMAAEPDAEPAENYGMVLAIMGVLVIGGVFLGVWHGTRKAR